VLRWRPEHVQPYGTDLVQALGIKLYKSEKISSLGTIVTICRHHHRPASSTNRSIYITMKFFLILASALGAAAFPGLKTGGVPLGIRSLLDNPHNQDLEKRQQDALGTSKMESNCGTRLCPRRGGQRQWRASVRWAKPKRHPRTLPGCKCIPLKQVMAGGNN